MADNIEKIILQNLTCDENYARQILPYVKPEYFINTLERKVYEVIVEFFEKYNKVPTVEAISIGLDADIDRKEKDAILGELRDRNEQDPTWLLNETENFCKEKAIFLALEESVAIYEGEDKKRDRGAIPGILTDALAICFDPIVGHDYLNDDQQRYEYYHQKAFKIPFHLEYFNKITGGGVEKKTLNVVLGGTGVGKTILMCDLAAHYMRMGNNVLYITMEMADKKIGQRIDCNLMDLSFDQLQMITHDVFNKKMAQIKEHVKGQLVVKEYPTGAAHSGHFRHLINELMMKKNFKIDVLIIDYINICASARLKRSAGSAETSYVIKSIAEEFRGLGVEYNVPVWTGSQFNREGFDNSDPSMTQTAESWGLPQTADFMFALIGGESLDKLRQRVVKQLKNRYEDENLIKKFAVGIDKPHMRFFNLEASAQNLSDGEETQPQGVDSPREKFKIRSFGKKDKFNEIKMGET